MRHYLTALDATIDHNVFKNVSESDHTLMHLDDTPKKVKDMCVISAHVAARFDKEDLRIKKFSREEITVDRNPDTSKLKYFTIWFN